MTITFGSFVILSVTESCEKSATPANAVLNAQLALPFALAFIFFALAAFSFFVLVASEPVLDTTDVGRDLGLK